uniref:hypothetical protein n=1 Tax=Neisseria sicca TaxID=490 RepID=UPI001649B6C8
SEENREELRELVRAVNEGMHGLREVVEERYEKEGGEGEKEGEGGEEGGGVGWMRVEELEEVRQWGGGRLVRKRGRVEGGGGNGEGDVEMVRDDFGLEAGRLDIEE